MAEELEYSLSSDGSYYIVIGIGTVTGSSVTIPATHNDLPVKAIGEGAFKNSTIVIIIINVNIIYIGEDAFAGCSDLDEIYYEGTIADWCEITFGNANSNPLYNGHHLYIDNTLVEELVIPEGVTEIKDYAFAGGVFVKITINVTVIIIGDDAFAECSGITHVYYGGTIADWCKITFGNANSNPLYKGHNLYIDGTLVEDLVIPDGVTEIKDHAFVGGVFVTITINVTVVIIGADAFANCSGVTHVYYGGTIAQWCGISFGNANSNPLYVGHYLYIGGSRVDDLVISGDVSSIGANSFAGAIFISITIDITITIIGNNAFVDCTATTITFGGTQSVWENVTIGSGNSLLDDIICHTHSYTGTVTTQPTCTEAGVMTYTCSCGRDSYTEAISATGHTAGAAVKENEVAATCTTDGSYDEVVYCTKCDEELSRETVTVSATGHIEGEAVKENEVAATCTTDGSYEKVVYCTECGIQLSRETVTVVATGHSYSDEWSYDENAHWHAATCGHSETSDYAEHTFTSGVCSVCGYTQTQEEVIGTEGLEYTLSSDGMYYTVTGIGTATETDIVIPSTYNGLPVKAIAASAFKNCTTLTSIVVPDSVTSIGSGAFSGCSSLQSITLPFVGGSVKTSSDTYQYPFGYIFGTSSYTGGTLTWQYYYGSSTSSTTSTIYYIPTSLTSVTITGGNILRGAFYGCSKLTSITIPDSITSIGNYAFYNCSSLTSITIPNSVTSIGDYAFGNCTALESITIPDSVTSIGDSAFRNCTSLTSVNIPNSVTSIGVEAFGGCTSLESITVNSENTVYHSSGNCIIETASKTLVVGCRNSVIPTDGSVTSIGEYAFYGCSSLTSITIPDSVISIGSYAFYGCTALTSVIIGNGVTSIGRSAFTRCSSLTSITIPDSVTSIGISAFASCSSLTSITIPDSVTSIGQGVFYNCTSLTSITIPDGVTSIGYMAFDGCTSLTSVTIGNSVTSIGNYAFNGCSSLEVVYYGGTEAEWANISIDSRNTYLTSATRYYYSETQPVTEGNYWHYAEDGVTIVIWEIKDDASEEVIGTEGLEYTLSSDGKYYTVVGIGTATATDIVIPSTYNGVAVTAIAVSAFKNCTTLTSIVVPDSVTSIGSGAFSGCSSLQSITLAVVGGSSSATSASSSTLFGYIFGTSSYNGGTATSQSYSSSSSSYTTYYIPTSLKSVTITGGNILYGAFYNCSNLTSVIIGNSVTSIGGYAFYNCYNLTSVTIGNSVTSIDSGAFYNCTALTSIIIPDSVTSIGSSAFRYCTSLTSVTFENTTGWRRYTSSTSTSGTSFSSSGLADTSTAAKYLTSTYRSYYWKRS